MSLKDEFLKANLISKKDARRITHEERVEKKQLGQQGIQEKEEKRKQHLEEKQLEKKKRDKALAEEQKKKTIEKEQESRIEDIIRQGDITDKTSGNNRFYFVAKNGKISFLCVAEGTGKNLERGAAAIIQCGDNFPEFRIVSQQSAEKILVKQPDMVRFYQRQSFS